MSPSNSARKPAWLVTLTVAACMAAIGVVFALFGSVHTMIIIAVMIVPVLLLAGLLYLVERVARRVVS